jgi:hypothetical protein
MKPSSLADERRQTNLIDSSDAVALVAQQYKPLIQQLKASRRFKYQNPVNAAKACMV